MVQEQTKLKPTASRADHTCEAALRCLYSKSNYHFERYPNLTRRGCERKKTTCNTERACAQHPTHRAMNETFKTKRTIASGAAPFDRSKPESDTKRQTIIEVARYTHLRKNTREISTMKEGMPKTPMNHQPSLVPTASNRIHILQKTIPRLPFCVNRHMYSHRKL